VAVVLALAVAVAGAVAGAVAVIALSGERALFRARGCGYVHDSVSRSVSTIKFKIVT
jgi:hypothetical protein